MIGQFDRLFLCFIIDSLKNKTQGTNKKDSSYKLKHGKNKIRCPADSCLLSKRSEQGRYLAASRSLMSRFEDVDDPRLIALWREKGVINEVKEMRGERWLLFYPAVMYKKTSGAMHVA